LATSEELAVAGEAAFGEPLQWKQKLNHFRPVEATNIMPKSRLQQFLCSPPDTPNICVL